MEKESKDNPLYEIFKTNPSGLISAELKNFTKFPVLYEYLKDNTKKVENKIKIINKLIELIKSQRKICAFMPKYDNKSIYIFLFDLFFNEKSSNEFKQSIINLIKELSLYIEINKEIYENIFQRFSLLYRKDKKILSNISTPVSFNNYFNDLLNALYATFGNDDEKEINKINPRNYYSCSGENNFTVYFTRKSFFLGNFISIIINFKISDSKLMKENPEAFGSCSLIQIKFNDLNKGINVELKYPYLVILHDGKKEYNAKVCPYGEWINLIMAVSIIDDTPKIYFFVNGENSRLPLTLKYEKLQKNDIINSITFFNNFYGEVSSISLFSLNQNDSLDIFYKTLKYFLKHKEGLWKRKYLNDFLSFLQTITYGDKKNEKNEQIITGNLCQNIVFIFTPFNYNISQPHIIEDCLGKFKLIIAGNIVNHKYQKYQKKIMQICTINNFLPISEMFLIYQKELLNEKNFLLYLKIIAKIVFGKKNIIFMNESNFFQLFSLFIEKIPNNFLNENILNELYNIGKIIISQNIQGYSSNYFNNILLNEKIIFKYKKEIQIKLWNLILKLCISDHEQIESFINIKKICILIRYYDKESNNEMCCQYHLNMYKKDFIGNMKVMEPNLNERLIHIQKILDAIILIQNPEKLVSLYKLLLLDLSPCLTKFIIKIIINALGQKNKDEEWKKKLVLSIINYKYDIIIVNAFIHSLPDIKFELLILMNSIFTVLAKINKLSEFTSFEKMIKTCLLPSKIFYMEKAGNNYNCNKNQQDYDYIQDFNKKIGKNTTLLDDDKNNVNKNEGNNNIPVRSSKSNSIYKMASKFETKKNNNFEPQNKPDERKSTGGKSKLLNDQKGENPQKDMKIVNSNNNSNNNEINNINNRASSLNTMNKKEENIEYFFLKEGVSIYDTNKNKNETLIFKDELYDIYINSLYLLFLKWALGIPISYTSSTSSEIFSSLKQQKELVLKNNFLTNINIIELLFVLNNNLNNYYFTLKCLKIFEKLIEFPENSFIILSNQHIYSSLLDIIFKYYLNKTNSDEIVNQSYKIGKNVLLYTFINSFNYLKDLKEDCPISKLEIIFIWGEKIIVSDINDKKKVESTMDFIYEILFELLTIYKTEFNDNIEIDFHETIQPKKNFFLRNYLMFTTFVYNFCFHYRVDPVIKNSDMNAFKSESLNINIPEIFISGMRVDNSKGNDFCEYWKDFHLIEDILNKINYIFKSNYIKDKLKGDEINCKTQIIKKKASNKTKELKYDKYKKILNELILNKDKKNLFKNEIFFLCYYETSENGIEIIIPLIRVLSISYICILTIVKDSNDEKQFNYWLKEYKNLLKFTIFSSVNINKNIANDPKSFIVIQKTFLDVISSGLCFLNNLHECSIICHDKIEKYITNMFLLCFSILKYHFDGLKNNKGIKLFGSKSQNDLSSSAVIILFNEYVKDKNSKAPFININKLEKEYLNPSFKIIDLIKDTSFYEILFENSNLKNQLFEKYYSINPYKKVVDKRYNLIRTLDDKLDYSYQINLDELLPAYEKELLKYSSNSIKNKKNQKILYKKYKKKIFSWNGMWSNKELFYGEISSHKIKYKVINHYTKNFMRPLISPILDINYYLPKFTQYNKNELFIKKEEEKNTNNIISNDLILDFDKILKISGNKKEQSSKKNNNLNLLISDKSKNAGNSQNDKSKNRILNQIYYKSNSKFCEFLIKLSNLIKNEKEVESQKDEGNEEEDDIQHKDSIRKDTLQTLTTSCSTIKNDNFIPEKAFKNSFVNLTYDKETNKIKNEEFLNNKEYLVCCLVKPSHHIKGAMFIREKKLNFRIFSDQKRGTDINGFEECFSEKDDDYDKERGTCYGSYFTHHPKDKNLYKMSISFNEILWILKRKYYYKNSAIEIFTIKNKSYYFNFKDEESQIIIIKEITKKIGDCLKIFNDIRELPSLSSSTSSQTNIDNIIGYQNNTNPIIIKNSKFKTKKHVRLSTIINQWKNWEISNFELLMLLNIFSNRSYNDITQYPVFPWILSNYTDPLKSEKVQTNENNDKDNNKKEENIIEDYSYRDLSLPMGMLTINEDSIKRKNNFMSSYKVIKQEENMTSYIFGCNYSNPTYVCNYLIRLFPFTQICIEIQVTGFDNPRRLFTSIEKSFKNATSASTDVREIIPEFFYFPEIFFNLNYLNMGKLDKDNNVNVNDVVTPCRNNPFEFIYTMKNVLENENVSSNINNWIDLIFGYKAKGKEAENARNLFTDYSYQEDVNINLIEDKDSYLRYCEFGLIPNQLFNAKEFPKKEKLDDVKKFKQVTEYSFKLKKYKCKSSSYSVKYTEDLLLLSVINTSQDKIMLLYNTNFIIEERISYSIFDKEYSEEILGKKLIPQTLNKMDNYFLPNNHKNKNIKIICGGKIIVMGGYYDAKVTFAIFDMENSINATIREIIPFKDESYITTLNIDKDEEYIFIGNSFGNVCIIKIAYNNQNNFSEFKMMNLITDQLNSISYIDSNNTLNIWASASTDGYVNIYTIPTFKLTRSFKVSLNSEVNYIYICDSPLPSILIIGQEEVYLYSINGFKIYNMKEYSNIINPIVIKDFIGNDYLAYILNNKEIYIRKICDFSMQMRADNDSEIYYLLPSPDMKMLYALNKSGTQIDVFMCDTKKTSEENQ